MAFSKDKCSQNYNFRFCQNSSSVPEVGFRFHSCPFKSVKVKREAQIEGNLRITSKSQEILFSVTLKSLFSVDKTMVPAVIKVAGIMSCFEVNFGCSEKLNCLFL